MAHIGNIVLGRSVHTVVFAGYHDWAWLDSRSSESLDTPGEAHALHLVYFYELLASTRAV